MLASPTRPTASRLELQSRQTALATKGKPLADRRSERLLARERLVPRRREVALGRAVALVRSVISPRSKQSPASWTAGPMATTRGGARTHRCLTPKGAARLCPGGGSCNAATSPPSRWHSSSPNPSTRPSKPRRSHASPPDPTQDRRPRRSSLRLVLRAHLHDNPRGSVTQEVIALTEACAAATSPTSPTPLHHYIRLD